MQTHSLMQAAALLGVHKTTLQSWLALGCPAVEKADVQRGQSWKLELPAIIEWRIGRAVADAVAAYSGDGDEISKEEADRRRAVALAHMAEIDLDDRLQRTVDRAEAVAVFADFCMSIRAGMSSALDKIAVRATTMTQPTEIRAFGQSEWNRAMMIAREEFARLWEERFGSKGSKPDPSDA